MEIKEKDHPLSLKVMRLTRPSLFTGVSVTCDPRDIPGDILNIECKNDMAIPQPDTGIGQVLLLPQSFGNIYLGETFACCICVHNSSNDVVYDVALKAILQMSNQRVPLLEEEETDLTQLAPDDLINKIIQHEVKEIGTHILVCAVHYKGIGGFEQSFRKFFKFQVLKPLGC
ncbi:Trafficking protein particle complex subunit 13 [Armadillidium vulgare]|nr:Trafficking protein particle complex subunit 13 [Armadillidium vulgare]